MIAILTRNTLYILSGLAIIVALYVAFEWQQMTFLHRVTSLFFIAIVAHLWEEGRFPGGFTQLITDKLGFTASNPHFGEMVTAVYVLGITFVPLFFPNVVFLALAPLLLGILEAIAHTAAIWMFRLKHFYSPGLATALLVLLPLSIFGMSHIVRDQLAEGSTWILSFAYLVGTLMAAQQIVVRAGGMKYSDFLKNVKATFSAGSKNDPKA